MPLVYAAPEESQGVQGGRFSVGGLRKCRDDLPPPTLPATEHPGEIRNVISVETPSGPQEASLSASGLQ